MKKFVSIVGAFSIALSLQVRATAAEWNPSAVVEMFTSQGCSSCPPADEIVADYTKQPGILALSWHVDYWNYLGWKDTFSHKSFTERQQLYAVSFRRRGVYTPQAVVNGRNHTVGSRHGAIEELRKGYEATGRGLTVPVKTERVGNSLRVSAKVSAGEATLWIVYYDLKKKVKIQRGENRGRSITYHNVVRDFDMLGMMKDGSVDVTLPMPELKKKGHDALAILLQQTTNVGTPGPIVGAVVVDDVQ